MAAVGLPHRQANGRADQVANGVAAAAHAFGFEGFQFAKEHGKGNEYNHRVLTAFFMESKDIGNIGVLTKLAGEVGLDEKEFETALKGRNYREAHQRALRHAYEEAGVTGVPMFVVGSQVLVGLQDQVTLEAVVEEELAASKEG